MGRPEFSAPEESDKEKHRKAAIQVQYSLLGAFLGAIIGTAPFSTKVLVVIAAVLGLLPFLTNRYWDRFHGKLPI